MAAEAAKPPSFFGEVGKNALKGGVGLLALAISINIFFLLPAAVAGPLGIGALLGALWGAGQYVNKL